MESLERILNSVGEPTYYMIKELGMFIDRDMNQSVINSDFDPRIHVVKHNVREFFQYLAEIMSKMFPLE